MNKTSVGKDSMVLWHVRDLSEQDGKDFDLEQYLSELYSDEYALKKIRDGWCDTAYVTDRIYKHTELFVDGFCTLFDYTSFIRQMLGIVPGARPEAPEDLFRGELEAVVFKVGSYLVRASSRIYVVSSKKYYPLREVPASFEITDQFKSLVEKDNESEDFDLMRITRAYFDDPEIRSVLRLTTEICAMKADAQEKNWKYVCRAAVVGDMTWYEKIINIITVRECKDSPVQEERLYVGVALISKCMSETWYRFEG